MTKQPIFVPNDHGSYDVSPAGVLFIAATTVWGPPHETTPKGIRAARDIIDSILAAARAGGFKQSDILMALMAKNPYNPRVIALAEEAVDAAGVDALRKIYVKHQL
jgi:hypothetical protein